MTKTIGRLVGVILWVVYLVLEISNRELGPGEFIGLIVLLLVLTIIAVLASLASQAVGGVLIVLFVVMLFTSGFNSLRDMLGEDPAVISITKETKFVEAPENVEDPKLQTYLKDKVSFEENWLEGRFLLLLTILMFGYALASFVTLLAQRNGFGLIGSIPIELVLVVISCLVFDIMSPNSYPDYQTEAAANKALWLNFFGTAWWSSLVALVVRSVGNVYKTARQSQKNYRAHFQGGSPSLSNRLEGLKVAMVLVFCYPFISYIFDLVGINLINTVWMGNALYTTSITLQMWTENSIQGAAMGLFIPPTVIYFIKVIKYACSQEHY